MDVRKQITNEKSQIFENNYRKHRISQLKRLKFKKKREF